MNIIDNYMNRSTIDKYIECDNCLELGEIECSRKELIQYLENWYRGLNYYNTFIIAIDIYRQWKKTNKILCPSCEGYGYFKTYK